MLPLYLDFTYLAPIERRIANFYVTLGMNGLIIVEKSVTPNLNPESLTMIFRLLPDTLLMQV
jgi:hypothetical protein